MGNIVRCSDIGSDIGQRGEFSHKLLVVFGGGSDNERNF